VPESKHYIVTQTRRVKVTANTPLDAGKLAEDAFEGKATSTTDGPWGYVTDKVEVTEFNIEKER
jgi:hypothetical protein